MSYFSLQPTGRRLWPIVRKMWPRCYVPATGLAEVSDDEVRANFDICKCWGNEVQLSLFEEDAK